MNFRLSTALAAVACLTFAACHPYNENANKKTTRGPVKTQPTPEEIKKKKEAEERKKQEEALKQAGEGATTTPDGGTAGQPKEEPTTTTPPVSTKPNDYVFANKVPGKEGFVFSPYNNKVVDVRGLPSGTLVQDPTYPPTEKKYFRVP